MNTNSEAFNIKKEFRKAIQEFQFCHGEKRQMALQRMIKIMKSIDDKKLKERMKKSIKKNIEICE